MVPLSTTKNTFVEGAEGREVIQGGGGLRPKNLCAKNGSTTFSQWEISFFSTVVTLVRRGVAPLLLRCTAILILPWQRAGTVEEEYK